MVNIIIYCINKTCRRPRRPRANPGDSRPAARSPENNTCAGKTKTFFHRRAARPQPQQKAHDGTRTRDLILTKDVLYRLSYMGGKPKRTMRLELTTATLEGWSSTIELCPRTLFNGQGWFRTTVGRSQWIYSPSPLTTRAPTRNIIFKPVKGLEPPTIRLQVESSTN